jgi:hypothetical protein
MALLLPKSIVLAEQRQDGFTGHEFIPGIDHHHDIT